MWCESFIDLCSTFFLYIRFFLILLYKGNVWWKSSFFPNKVFDWKILYNILKCIEYKEIYILLLMIKNINNKFDYFTEIILH